MKPRSFAEAAARCTWMSLERKRLLRDEIVPAVGSVLVAEFAIGDADRAIDALPSDYPIPKRRLVATTMQLVLQSAIESGHRSRRAPINRVMRPMWLGSKSPRRPLPIWARRFARAA